MRLATLDGNINEKIRSAIEAALPGAIVQVAGGGGHFSIEVTHPAFEGKNKVGRQRLVLTAVQPLMAGPSAPVHAIDSLKTWAPGEAG